MLTAIKSRLEIQVSTVHYSLVFLEPVCCEKQQKTFLTSYWFVEWGTSEGPEWFIADCIWVQVIPLIVLDQFYSIHNLQRSTAISQTINWSGTLFCCSLQQTGSSHSKPSTMAHVRILKCFNLQHNVIKTKHFRSLVWDIVQGDTRGFEWLWI